MEKTIQAVVLAILWSVLNHCGFSRRVEPTTQVNDISYPEGLPNSGFGSLPVALHDFCFDRLTIGDSPFLDRESGAHCYLLASLKRHPE